MSTEERFSYKSNKRGLNKKRTSLGFDRYHLMRSDKDISTCEPLRIKTEYKT